MQRENADEYFIYTILVILVHHYKHKPMDYLYADETYKIRGAIFEVYKEMGCGFLESVYQECMEIELKQRGIPFFAQYEVSLSYKEQKLKQKYIPDFLCFDNIVVEIKAVKELTNKHQAQVINYLKATGIEIGLLVNFGSFPNVEIKRLIYS